MGWLWAIGASLAAYLVGSIPTAYLLVRWLKGVDIRTVGSGNVGATNAARVLGGRFFPLVFGLDLLKGLLPTALLPIGVARLGGESVSALPVLAALGAILGHNFPVYLGFRGGKGVATSLGAVIALDWAAALAAALGFVVLLLVTRIVSVSSLGAGLLFAIAHFARVGDPWAPGERVLSGVICGLLVMLFARHRSNLVRLARGTEPRVGLGPRRGRGREEEPRS